MKNNINIDDQFFSSYLKDNKNLYKNLIIARDNTLQGVKILNEFGVQISSKQGYKNFIDIYIPEAIEYYDFCKKSDTKFSDILSKNNFGMRAKFKSFISEVEKFLKFVHKELFGFEAKKFKDVIYSLLNKLDKLNLPDIPKDVIPSIKTI